MNSAAARLRCLQAWDRWRLRRLRSRYSGLEIDPAASTNLAAGRYALENGSRLVIHAGVAADRAPGGLVVLAAPGSVIEIGAGTWLRGEVEPVRLVAFPDARLTVGPEAFLNGCHLSAKREVSLGRRAWVGLGSRVFDSDQHDYDVDRMERVAPVRIGDHTWIAADVTVLRGVTIGNHCVIGSRSLVTHDVPDHSLAFGQPATVRGEVGDRSQTG